VPPFLAQALRLVHLHGLQEEGIGRVTGRAEAVDGVRDALHAGQEVNLFADPQLRDPHTCMSLIKRFLNDLPETLIPRKDRARAWAATSAPGIRAFVVTLPPANLAVLRAVVEMFFHIFLNAHVNKMGLEPLVKILAPNLLPFDSVTEYQATNALAGLLIEHYPEVGRSSSLVGDRVGLIFSRCLRRERP
jgi:hypothetical protein